MENDNRKYWHELSKEEFDSIPGETLCSELRAKYKQPDWCTYPEAIDALGCWSLIGDRRTQISKSFCGKCDLFKEKIMTNKPCTFNRQEYLECSDDFEKLKVIDTEDNELTEFNHDAKSIALELAYTRYELAKAEQILNDIAKHFRPPLVGNP